MSAVAITMAVSAVFLLLPFTVCLVITLLMAIWKRRSGRHTSVWVIVCEEAKSDAIKANVPKGHIGLLARAARN